MSENMKLNDEAMAKTNGGAADVDPYGYLCEGTVKNNSGSNPTGNLYSVDGDNGKSYWGTWDYRSVLSDGDRVRIIHAEDGSYVLEPLDE